MSRLIQKHQQNNKGRGILFSPEQIALFESRLNPARLLSDTVTESTRQVRERTNNKKRTYATKEAIRKDNKQSNSKKIGNRVTIASTTNPEDVRTKRILSPKNNYTQVEQRVENPERRVNNQLLEAYWTNKLLLDKFNTEVLPATGSFMEKFMPSTLVGALTDKNRSFVGSMVEGNKGLGEIDESAGAGTNFLFDVTSPGAWSKGLKLLLTPTARKAINYMTTVKFPTKRGDYLRLGPLVLEKEPGVLSSNGLGGVRMRLADLESELASRGIDNNWIEYGRHLFLNRFAKNGEFITGPERNFEDMFYIMNRRLDSVDEPPIHLDDLLIRTPLQTPIIRQSPVEELVNGMSGSKVLADKVIRKLGLSENGKPINILDLERRLYVHGEDRFDPNLFQYNMDHPQISQFDDLGHPKYLQKLFLLLSDYYNSGKFIKTRGPGQTPYTTEEIQNMFTPTGEMKDNVMLEYFYPGKHGVHNWYDEADNIDNDVTKNIIRYIRTINKSPVTYIKTGRRKHNIISGAFPDRGRVVTTRDDMNNLLFMNPRNRSGVYIPSNDALDFLLSTDSSGMSIDHIGKELSKGRQITVTPGNNMREGSVLNNLGLTNRYDWEMPFNESALNFFKKYPSAIDHIIANIDDAGKITVEYGGKPIAIGRERTLAEIRDILNKKHVIPFNETHGKHFELMPFTSDNDYIYNPRNLGDIVIHKQGGKHELGNKKKLIQSNRISRSILH